MKPTVLSEFLIGLKQGPRLFFSPFVGAYKGMRDEADRIYEENKLRWERQRGEARQRDKHP